MSGSRSVVPECDTRASGAHGEDEWPHPLPLDAQADLPKFPLAALPSWLREWVEAEAQSTQTPPDVAAMLALAVIATACQRLMVVHVRDGWMEPLNIYTAPVLPPGSRKSAVMRDARKPLDEYDGQNVMRVAPAIARSQDMLAAAQKRLEHAIAQVAKTSASSRISADADLRDARAELTAAEKKVVFAPQLTCGDCTQEALALLLERNGECMALLDAEGCGPLAIMAGRYTDGAAAIDLYLRAHAGDAYRCDRVGRKSIVLRRPALTMAVTVQPEMLRQLGDRREMRGLGLLARILWVLPLSTVGRRASRPGPMREHVRAAYSAHIRTLLDCGSHEGRELTVIELSAAADDALAALSDRLEPRLGDGGDLDVVRDWAGKLAGSCARIAGLLHAAQHTDCPSAEPISYDTMQRAIQIGEYLLEHAIAALNEMAAHSSLADARHVLRWLQAHDIRTISRRDLWHQLRGRFPRVALINPALSVLLERGWIREFDVARDRGRPGRQPSPILELSPFARRESSDHNVQNDHKDPVSEGMDHTGQCGQPLDPARVRRVDGGTSQG